MNLFILFTLFALIIGVYLRQRQIKHIKQKHIAKSIQNYTIAKLRVEQLSWFTLCVVIGFCLTQKNLVWLTTHIVPVFLGTALIFMLFLLQEVFNFYKIFYIDARYHIATITFRRYALDLMKRLIMLLTLVFIIFEFFLFLALHLVHIAFMAWVIVLTLFFLHLFIGNYFIRLFNAIIPWQNRDSIQAINQTIAPYGMTVTTIEIFDQSVRSSQGNAYISGLGRSKKILLADTLMDKMSNEELVAIIFHELGHYYYQHILKGSALFGLLSGLYFWLYAITLSQDNLMIASCEFILFAPIFYFYCKPLKNSLSRYFEYQADHFAGLCHSADILKEVLTRLADMNKSTRTADQWYKSWFYSHPTIAERVERLC